MSSRSEDQSFKSRQRRSSLEGERSERGSERREHKRSRRDDSPTRESRVKDRSRELDSEDGVKRRRSASPRDRDRRRDRYRDVDRDRTRERGSHRHRSRSRSRSRSKSPDHRSSRRRRSKSPRRGKKHRSRSRSRSASPIRRSKKPLASQDESFQRHNNPDGDEEEVVKKKPNFGTTGLLAKEANTVAGTKIVLKYHEPPEARKPSSKEDWRLFIFKAEDLLETVPLSLSTCWLIGKEAAVADLVVEHPSTSKQHAVIQFRYVEKVVSEYGDKKGKVKPYIIDLESSNGTVLNGDKIATRRFIEVRSGDVMKIGLSEREYVFMLAPKDKDGNPAGS